MARGNRCSWRAFEATNYPCAGRSQTWNRDTEAYWRSRPSRDRWARLASAACGRDWVEEAAGHRIGNPTAQGRAAADHDAWRWRLRRSAVPRSGQGRRGSLRREGDQFLKTPQMDIFEKSIRGAPIFGGQNYDVLVNPSRNS